MKKNYKQILIMLGVCTLLGILSGLIFGYLYNQYIKFFIISLGISYTIWLFNSLLFILLIPKIKYFPKGKNILYKIIGFFITTLFGFIISTYILNRVFEFEFFKEKAFLTNLLLLVLLYTMIAGLIFSFKFFKEMKENEITAEKLKALASEEKLKALKSQINPHFLFNTLNSINALVTRNANLSRKMITLLSELLRTSLENHDKMLVPLKKELDFAHLYLEIEKIRFKNKMDFQEDINPKLLGTPFPAMVLQPLLENAVKHGILSSRKGGSIQLTVKKEGNLITCFILNTVGKTMTGQSRKSAVEGTGLANIHQRLNLIYKEKHDFQAGYTNNRKFEVKFSLPIMSPGFYG